MDNKVLEKTNYLTLSANEGYNYLCPSEVVVVVNYEESSGNLWICIDGEATIGGTNSFKMPPFTSATYIINNPTNEISILSESGSVIGIYTPQK